MPDGYIVTNAHVVTGAQRVPVDIRLPGAGDSILAAQSRTVNAAIVGIDLETDIAVIKVEERSLAALPLAIPTICAPVKSCWPLAARSGSITRCRSGS